MHLLKVLLLILCAAIFPCAKALAIEAYQVRFEGNLTPHLRELLQSGSDLVKLQESPPATVAGLQHRAEADIKNFLKVLHSQALFNATVDIQYNLTTRPVLVTILINTGPVYPLEGFNIVGDEKSLCYGFPFEAIRLCDIGIELHTPAFTKKILDAEESILYVMARRGYPLAVVIDREVIADQSQNAIFVTLHIDSGPAANFGLTTLTGLCSVKEEYILQKIAWCEGRPYNPCLVDKTQNALEATGLFSSISITHADEMAPDGRLPMQIELLEAKHRSIGLGLSYATDWGPGATFEWQHRNVAGMGEKLSCNLGVWQALQKLNVRYLKPDFLRPCQDFVWIAEALHDKTKGYHETYFSLAGMIERQLNQRLRISYGGMYKILHDTRSDANGQYNLLKAPFYVHYNNSNNLIDPTYGTTVHLKIIPSWQFLRKQFAYCINLLTNTFYYPLTCDHSYVLAGKMTLGTILGSRKRTIPPSERFYEGSDNNMRGFRFMTVSPIDHHHKPTGGRSVMTYSLELRAKATESIGWVAFYDFGNVYANIVPDLNKRFLQSVGVGLRYHTPVGPLRLDFAVPLTPRKHVDHHFQVYLSIGQAF